MFGTNFSRCVIYYTLHGEYTTMDIQEWKYGGCMVAMNETTVLWIGGKTDSVLSIDVASRTYQEIATLPQRRYYAGCTLYGESNIAICGGFAWPTYYSSCISLSLDTHQWGTLPAMNTQRAGFQLINWKGRLYAIGGMYLDGGGRHILSSIEYLNGSSWHMSTIQLPTPLYFFGAAVVQD